MSVKKPNLQDVLKYAFTYWRPYWSTGIVVAGCLLSFSLFKTFFAYSLKIIIDSSLTPDNNGSFFLC